MTTFNKPYCLISTYYLYKPNNIHPPSKEHIISKFGYDGSAEDLYINFNNTFDPWHTDFLEIGQSGRRDLVYGKIFLLKNFIEKYILNNYDYLCHIDFNDTRFVQSFISMMTKFEQSQANFLIATEKQCWPDIEKVSSWSGDRYEPKEFCYVNSGCIISKTEIFYNYLNDLINLCLKTNIDFVDDQGVWQYYDLVCNKLNKDKNCEYFFCTGLLDDSYYKIDNNKIKTKFNTYPYIIHDNGSFNLNLIHTFKPG